MKILVINCGSSTLKFQLVNPLSKAVAAKGLCERIGIEGSRIVCQTEEGGKTAAEIPMRDHKQAFAAVIAALTDKETGVVKDLMEIGAVGHRVVHGGERFSGATLIDEQVKKQIAACSELAPLHNPANLTGIEASQALMPDTPMAAVFDTAFHQTMPAEAYLYAIPYRYYRDYSIRKYGFHGTSHSYVAGRAAKLLGKSAADMKLIICHLGNGASVSAVKNGVCIDTSMGLTPLEGLIMGTRSGDIDPAVIQFISNKEKRSVDEVLDILNKESGVLGLSEDFSPDFRDLEDGYLKGKDNCVRALDAYALRVLKYIGAYLAELDGTDAICFTAGVGENSPFIRELICKRLNFLGIELEDEANHKRGQEIVISKPGNGPKLLVIPTNEELAIAMETYRLTAGGTDE